MDARDVVPGKLPTQPPSSSCLLSTHASISPCPRLAPSSSTAPSLSARQLANSHVLDSFPYVATSSVDSSNHHRDPSRLNLANTVCNKDGSTFMGERLTVQFARGSRHRENGGPGGPGGFASNERAPPRPRRTPHRMQISGLPTDTSWQVCSSSYSLLPDSRMPVATAICVSG